MQRYVTAITSARDPKLASDSLQLALSEKLPPLIAERMPAAVAANGHGLLAWSFAKAHGKELLSKVAVGAQSSYFPNIVATSSDAAVADDLVAYVKATLPPEASTEAERTADQIRFQARLKARLLPQIAAALPIADKEHKP
jgi:hypothetical protein